LVQDKTPRTAFFFFFKYNLKNSKQYMFSLVLKLHVKYASDLLPVLKASMQGKGVIQELNCEDGGAQGGSYIHISVDKSRGGEKRWSWPIGK